MLCIRYSLFLLFILTTSAFAQKYNSKQCLDASFNTQIKNEGRFFGLIKNDLKINKNQCIIEIAYKNILETKWHIDVCREPIHIKVTSKGSQSVYKRRGDCKKNKKSDFCLFYQELDEILQDYGLIFAKGEREVLSTSHGQTYCTFLLLRNYLKGGYLFSKYDHPKNIFTDKDGKKEACDLPVSTPQPVQSSSAPEMEKPEANSFEPEASTLPTSESTDSNMESSEKQF